MFKNGTVMVPERTFKRYYKSIDDNCKVLKKLLVILEKYKDNVDDFFKLISAYHIDNFKSEHIKNLDESHNLAIKIPKFKGVDYEAVKSKADKILASKNSKKSTNSISSEKVILFLYLMHEFNYISDFSFYGNVSISSNKFSKFLGDTKAVNAIRDAYEDAGILTNKSYAIIEVQSTSYNLSIDLDVQDYIALSDPYLIKILNDNHSLEHNYFLEDRLSLLNKVIDVIETRNKDVENPIRNKIVINRIKYRPNRESYKVRFKKGVGVKVSKSLLHDTVDHNINLTNVFLKSGNFSSIRSLLNIVIALKSRISSNTNKNIDSDLALAFDSVDFSIVKKLYYCCHNKLSGILNHFANRSHFNFYVPALNLATKEDAMVDMKIKYKEEYIKAHLDTIAIDIMNYIENGRKLNNDDFINRLKDYCNIA